MFGYIPAAEQIVRERAKSAALEAANGKLAADLDYVAMMCDVELESEEITDVSENGDILAAESNEEGENNE